MAKPRSILRNNVNMGEVAHPFTDVVTGQMVGRAKEIRSVLAELGVPKRQKFITAIPNSNAVGERPVDTSEYFVVSLLVST